MSNIRGGDCIWTFSINETDLGYRIHVTETFVDMFFNNFPLSVFSGSRPFIQQDPEGACNGAQTRFVISWQCFHRSSRRGPEQQEVNRVAWQRAEGSDVENDGTNPGGISLMLDHCTNPSEAFHHFSQGDLIYYTKKEQEIN